MMNEKRLRLLRTPVQLCGGRMPTAQELINEADK